MAKVSILILAEYYLPGYKAGGPIRTLANIVDRLGHEFQFRILTTDRDIHDTKPYPLIKVDEWNSIGKADVFFMSKKKRSFRSFSRLLRCTKFDILYLNSFFSPHFAIKPLILWWLQLIPKSQIIIAPRGEFSRGAIGLKSLKKYVYINVARALGFYRGSIWQASSEDEKVDIRKKLGKSVTVIIAPDLATVVNSTVEGVALRKKIKGRLKLIFLSRISRMKNLSGALEMLMLLNGEIQFDIYGPIEDKSYWSKCKKIINALPENIEAGYCGIVKHDKVIELMKEYDFFFLPTLGENFGHVILEAFCAGCPAVISDQTTWRGLEEKGVGWDLPLTRKDIFRKILQKCLEMENDEYTKWSERARRYGMHVTNESITVEQNRKLFLHKT